MLDTSIAHMLTECNISANKKVKIALLINDKYTYRNKHIMSSQAQLVAEIAAYELQVADLESQIAAAQAGNNIDLVASLSSTLAETRRLLAATKLALQNLNTVPTVEDPAPPDTLIADQRIVDVSGTSTIRRTVDVPISNEFGDTAALQKQIDNNSDAGVPSFGATLDTFPNIGTFPAPVEDIQSGGINEFGDTVALQKQIDANLDQRNYDEPVLSQKQVNEELANAAAQNPAVEFQDSSVQGTTAAKAATTSSATGQDTVNFQQKADWRVRLSLAPGANYLYKASPVQGILKPLLATDGIIFPYTPSIAVSYAAHYDTSDLIHSNYKIFQYKNSSVDQVSITCEFTAQDTFEANYLLAVIHFLRSVTKMFYGQDDGPKPGTPPPLCYLTGLGAFQFDAHPLAITSFNYSLPTDVDYIRATNTTTEAGVNKSAGNVPINANDPKSDRMIGAGLIAGGGRPPPNYTSSLSGSRDPTYVPTKMQIQIVACPIVTRNDISKKFSLKEYATGALLQGTKRSGGGIW